MEKQELEQYLAKYKKLLAESVEWWLKYSPDVKNGGFYNYLGRDGKVLFTDKNVRQQGRFVLLFARAYNEIEKRQEWLDL
ncbi:MAG: AGE family epimerase/isomerase, partial [Kiritimatiellae bacterium]|nr:AGE family epimerase/isomerase [Kiritimatiellia bacterium]